jgi:hypothetical protein
VRDGTGATAPDSFPWVVANDVVVDEQTGQQTEPGAAADLQMKATDDTAGQTLTFSASGLPPGLSINPASGLISGTTGSAIATYTVTVTATDAAGSTGSASFKWAVENLITATLSGETGGAEISTYNVPASVQVDATDSAAGQTLSYSATNLPPGLTLNASTGLITGTPASAGFRQVQLTVTDGTGSAVTVYPSWYVDSVISLSAPRAQISTAGQTVYVRYRIADDAPGVNLSESLQGGPPGVTAYDGVLAGWPEAAGTYHVTILAQDGYTGTASASFTWKVKPAADRG